MDDTQPLVSAAEAAPSLNESAVAAASSGVASGPLRFSASALAEWRDFLVAYERGDFPRGVPPPIPSAISLLLASPAASDNSAAPPWLKNAWARPETPEELLEFFRIHRYLPSPPSVEDETRRRAMIKRYGLDDSNRLASIDEIADLGRLYFKGTTVIVTAVLEDVVFLLGQARSGEDDKMDWAGALRDLDQSLSLCRHGMLGKREDTFLILDSRTDWRVRDNPVFAQAGGPLAFYASSRVLLPLVDNASPDLPSPTLAVGNFCLMGKEPRAEGSFTDQDHAVLRNLAKRVSRELQLGYQERRRLRANDQADFISQLLQGSQSSEANRSPRDDKASPGMAAVNRDQLSLGASVLSANTAETLARTIDRMCALSSASDATVFDMRAFVKSSVESATFVDPRRPALRRTCSGTTPAQRALGTTLGADGTAFSVQRLRPVTVLGTSMSQAHLEERLSGQEALLAIERGLQQWRQNNTRNYLLGDALSAATQLTSQSRLAIPILDHANELALLILVSCDDGVLLEPDDLSFLENVGHIALSRLAKEQALQADQAKLAFVSQISHELRTPLHGLAGQLELIRSACTAVPQAPVDARTFAVADVCLESLREILDDTLSFAKLSQASSPFSIRPKLMQPELSEVVDLATLLKETTTCAWARKMRRASADGDGESAWEEGALDVEVVLDFAARDEGWMATVNVTDWRRTLANILSNAFTFTPTGGHVSVTLRESNGMDGHSSVTVEIEDSGIGMSDEFLRSGQLFQPFRQGDSFSPGSGLGMAIVNELVMRMKGRINVHSVLGKGTRVEVILPVDFVSSTPFSAIRQTLSDELGELQKVLGSPQPSQYASRSNSFSASPSLCPMTTVPATASTLSSTLVDCEDSASEESVRTPPQESPRMAEGKLPPVASAGRRLTIFAAEDNSIARNILSAMFSQQKGYNFLSVEDGQRAVDVFKTGHFRPDVTIMDIQMPRKDGLAASFEMREHEIERGWPRHRIIALTGLSNPQDMAKGLDNGGPIDDWVCKGGSALKHIGEEIEEMRRTLEREGTLRR